VFVPAFPPHVAPELARPEQWARFARLRDRVERDADALIEVRDRKEKVLYFEGETTLDHRILRATKNRFGGVDEIGVFRMTETGLAGVANPSELFLGDRQSSTSGTAIVPLLC